MKLKLLLALLFAMNTALFAQDIDADDFDEGEELIENDEMPDPMKKFEVLIPDTVAVIDGKVISRADILSDFQAMIQTQPMLGYALSQFSVNDMKTKLLEPMVKERIISFIAESEGYSVDTKRITAFFDAEIAKLSPSERAMAEQQLASQGRSFDSLKETILKNPRECQSIMIQLFISEKVLPSIQLTDEDVANAPTNSRNAMQISSDEAKANAKAKLQKIASEIKTSEDFAAKAKEFSACPSGASAGGDLGPFTKGKMDPAFEKAAFGLDVNQTSDVVETSFGYHIIRVTAKEADGSTVTASHILIVPELKKVSDVKPEGLDSLKGNKVREAIDAMINKNPKVKIFI